jgi:predicted small lipoprotein YifL
MSLMTFIRPRLKFLHTESWQTNQIGRDHGQFASFSLSLTPLPNIIGALMEPITVKLKPILLLFSLVLLIGLSGCGNKGPLTLADEAEKTESKSQDDLATKY